MDVRKRGLVVSVFPAAVLAALAAAAGPAPPPRAAPPAEIPAFSRLYRTSCSTCHLAPPKLNVLGQAFRVAGYRFPENDELLRDQEPVPLGAGAWKDAWPRAIWPGELPATPPLAVRVVNDVRWTADDAEAFDWAYRFPAEVHLLSATALGEGVSALAEVHWSPDEEIEVGQARIRFEIPLGSFSEGALNLGLGRMNLRLLDFGDPQLDQIGHEAFLWQTLETDAVGGSVDTDHRAPIGPAPFAPAIEVDGIVARRWTYGLGLADGGDGNDPQDLYWRVGVKLGGLGYDGFYEEGEGPVLGEGGQLFDRAVVLEHFGYLGSASSAESGDGDGWTWGAAARWMAGSWELGAGYVRGERPDPAALGAVADLEWRSAFARAEWFAWPWLIGSIKGETFRTSGREGGSSRQDRSRVLPGIVALIRPNVRLAVEASLWLEHEPADAREADLPHDLWVRLDLAF